MRMSRDQRIGASLMGIVALVCCFLPGFDSLGYFSALVIGAAGSTLGLVLGALESQRVRATEAAPVAVLKATVRLALILLAPPLVILSLNALLIPNCDLIEGAAFYGMSAGIGVLFATQLGAGCEIFARGGARGAVLALTVALAWTLRDIYHLYTDPPIFIYNPFFGFFSGAIYDDVIAIDDRFLWFRLANLLQLGVLWSLIRLGWHDGGWSVAALSAHGVRSRAKSWMTFAALSFLCGGLYGGRAAIGYEIDQAFIESHLGGRLESGTITLVYDQASIDEEAAERLMWDAQFRLSQLTLELDEDRIEPFTLFLYGSAEQKRHLMGARRVQLAKPWLRQAHMDQTTYGHRTLAHEMAHLLLASYSSPPLYVPAKWGLIVNAGVLEGTAVALEPPSGRFDVHQKSAAMRQLGLAPDLRTLLGPEGFWSQPASRAYTLTGSFLRWLRTTRGPDAFKSLYGSFDFKSVYDDEVEELVSTWEAWVDERPVSDELRAWADATYRRPGVLHRICPLEVARLHEEANDLLGAGKREDALSVLEEIVGHLPGDPGSLLYLATVLSETASPAELDRRLESMLAVDDLPVLIRARFNELQADVRWRRGDLKGAEARYRELSELPLDPAFSRRTRLKRDLCLSPTLEPVYGPYLLGGTRDPEVDLVYLTEAAAEHPKEALAMYLLGRRTLQTGHSKGSIGPLKTTLALLEDDDSRGAIELDTARLLEGEAWRLLGHALLHTGALLDSEAAFARAAQLSTTSGDRAHNLDWAARASWLRTHPDLQKQSVF